jgi:aryl-alcohol dehydrogenase-like predicted oxidoreductase
MWSTRELKLSGEVALGGAMYSLSHRTQEDDNVAVSVIRAAYDQGTRIFDTARAYAPVGLPFHNEELMRRALAGREDAIIATKGGHWRAGESDFPADNRPERLRKDAEDSLRALALDCLPLYYVHRVDLDTVPIEDSVGALDDLHRAGKIARIGISNVTAEQVRRAAATAPVSAVQNRLSVRTAMNADIVAACDQSGIAVFGYSPLRFRPPDVTADLRAALPRLAALAERHGTPLPRLALRGLMASSPVISLIVGAGRLETAREAALIRSEPWDDKLQAAFAHDWRPLP